jgi:hypothetical protein
LYAAAAADVAKYKAEISLAGYWSAAAASIAFAAAAEAEEMVDVPEETIARVLRQRGLVDQMASTEETSISLASKKAGGRRKQSRVGEGQVSLRKRSVTSNGKALVGANKHTT